MNYPKVSIIIPLYNYARYVLDAVQSCLYQKYSGDIEIIVVDDCSTDSGRDILNRNYRHHIKLLQTKVNSGYSVAKNIGIRNSTGEYIAALDADDMLTPDSIQIRADFLTKYPAIDFVHGRAYIVSDEGGIDYYMKRLYKLDIHKGSKIHAQTVMVRRNTYLKGGLYDENLRSRSDNELWFRFRYVCKFVDDRIEKPPIAFYRKHPLSMVEYRKKHPLYNRDVSMKLENAKEMRLREGVNRNNTPWLKR